MGIAFQSIRKVDDAPVQEKRVLVRVDLNVPMKDGVVGDTTRIERILPTLNDLVARRAKVIVLSHYGRPKGQPSVEYSLRPVAEKLDSLMGGTKVIFVEDCIGDVAQKKIGEIQYGEIAVLENLRFHPGEEENDKAFAQRLSELGDIYVNEAFSSAHRAHASIDALTKLLPAYAGKLMISEIKALSAALECPKRPVTALVGGAKVSTKIPVLTNLVSKMDMLIIGGGMANTFLYAQGVNVGKSLCEQDCASVVGDIMSRASESGCKIKLPTDAVVAENLVADAEYDVYSVGEIPGNGMILDIGPDTISEFSAGLGDSNTLLWNGPLGAFEVPPFGEGTFTLARRAAELTNQGKLISIAGGGDTVAALKAAGVSHDFTYVSTAGGAFLEWLEGRELPAVAALARASYAEA